MNDATFDFFYNEETGKLNKKYYMNIDCKMKIDTNINIANIVENNVIDLTNLCKINMNLEQILIFITFAINICDNTPILFNKIYNFILKAFEMIEIILK